MQKSILALLFSPLVESCGENKESKTYEDPGTLEGRIEQVCGCMEEKDYSDWQPCYDLNNKYYKMMEGEEQDKFREAMMECERKFNK